jgi:exodeoxyribonuclease V alpha subunit
VCEAVSSSDTTAKQAYPPTEHLQGIVERVTFHSEESGYTVARLKVPSAHDLLTIVGSFPDIHAGQTLRLGGYYREHPKYGQQFQVVWARHLVV